MAAYEYTARDTAGNEISSVYTNVESVRSLRRELVKLGYVLVHARRQRGSFRSRGRIRQREVASFAYKFGGMYSAGLSITSSLEILEQQTENEAFRAILGDIRRRVESGSSLKAAFDEHRSVFSDFFLGMIDGSSGAFSYCNAGHDPPLLIRRSGDVEELRDGGLVLGVLEEAAYEAGSGTLEPGDMLVLYTDGITETPLEGDGPEFGRERLARCAAEGLGLPAEQVMNRILRRVGEYRGEADQHDDLTLVVISRPLL